jgi:hypothetical protein
MIADRNVSLAFLFERRVKSLGEARRTASDNKFSAVALVQDKAVWLSERGADTDGHVLAHARLLRIRD